MSRRDLQVEQFESPELHQYRLDARAWLEDHVTLREANSTRKYVDERSERLDEFKELQRSLFEAGYAGFTLPVEYGGQGLTFEHERIFNEEAATYDLPHASFGVSINILGAALAKYGSHDQKLRHLPNILSGKEIWLQFLSEPGGGSDLAGLRTRATRSGDCYVVNGQKIWSSGAHLSDFALCPVRTRWDVPKHEGISVLIIDLKSRGIDIRRIKQIDGRSEFCEEFFTDLRVPVSNLVGEENQGWRITRGIIEIEHSWVGRGGAHSACLGNADDLVLLAESRGLTGDVGVRRSIVDFHVRATTQRLLSARLSDAMEHGDMSPAYGGLLKLGDVAMSKRRAELGLLLAGSRGVVWPPGEAEADIWATTFLDARRLSITGGTDEIQRNNVSERVLGLPREFAADRATPFNDIAHN